MSKRSQFLVDISKLILYADTKEIELVCFDFDRSQAEQDKNILTGKSWTRNSKHLKWQAMDLVIVENGKALFDASLETYKKFEVLGEFWEDMSSDHIWGAGKLKDGKRRDIYHFQLE